MIRRFVLAVLLMGAGSAVVAAQHQILPDFQADPSARVFNGRLYVYPSHDIAGNKDWDMVDWHVFSTDDMVHWTDHGTIFSLKDITWADKHAWAPDCIERNGKYFFYFPADDQIGVAAVEQATHDIEVAAIATDQPVPSNAPEIVSARNRLGRRPGGGLETSVRHLPKAVVLLNDLAFWRHSV